MATSIVIYKGKTIPQNPVVIEGFPSKGFVSTIAARYMIDELKMDLIGHIDSDKIKSVAVIHGSTPMRPIRLYAKDNLIVIFSEIIIPIAHTGDFSNAVNKWIDLIRPSLVVLLAGITGKESDKTHEIFGVATSQELNDTLAGIGVNKVEEGMLTGISSDMLLYCMDNAIPCISLMAETKVLPDPLAAASMLEILRKRLNMSISTQKLIEEGQKIEGMMKDISAQMQRGKEGAKEMDGYSPMYS
jgi:uncharacterized protein